MCAMASSLFHEMYRVRSLRRHKRRREAAWHRRRYRRPLVEHLEDRRLLTFGDLVGTLHEPPEPFQYWPLFGSAVATDGEWTVVGARGDDLGGDDAGAVHVFESVAGNYHQSVPNPAPSHHDEFGDAVAVSGNVMVVGAPGNDPDPGMLDVGLAHVYSFDGASWQPQATLYNPTPEHSDYFGWSVAVSGNVAIVGAVGENAAPGSGAFEEGAAYLFDATTGSLIQRLDNPTPPQSPMGEDWFGWSVAAWEDFVVVGAPNDGAAGYHAGSVYVYDLTTGDVLASLSNPAPTYVDRFGSAVAIWGDTLVVGARYADVGATDAGAAYVYHKDGADWNLTATLTNPAPVADALFGYSVAVYDDTVIVGTPRDHASGEDAGAAYVFDARSGNQIGTLANPLPEDYEQFGHAVAIFGHTALVSAPWDHVGAGYTGAVYAFDVDASAQPVANPDSYQAWGNEPLVVTSAQGVLTNDYDAQDDELRAIHVSGPLHGNLSLNGDGSFVYEPHTDFSGTDSFQYLANDGQADSNAAEVTITVRFAPTANAGGSYSLPELGSVTLDGSDSYDLDGYITAYEWDLDYDGVTFDVDAVGESIGFSAAKLPGPDTRMVALRVTDNDHHTRIDTATVEITDAYPANSILYVNQHASGLNNGRTWSDAFTDLQAALLVADPGDEIWVAEGTYKPTASADRMVRFELRTGVSLYGGFAGTEIDRDQRDWTTHVTTLSGDIGVMGETSDNSYHVVYASGVTDATLDGFTITAGYADTWDLGQPRGGGLCNDAGSAPTLTNLIFSGNYGYWGGGMYNHISTAPMLVNVIFRENTAGQGGGIYNHYSSATLTNVVFQENSAVEGGAIFNHYSSPSINNVTFYGNSADYYGGGILNYAADSVPIINNSILWGNTAVDGPQILNVFSAGVTVNYSVVEGGWPGVGNQDSDPLFVDAADGNLHLRTNSPAVDAGDNTVVPADATDLDGDGDSVEPLPLDLDLLPRFYDLVSMPDQGNGTAPIVDMGAYEFPVDPPDASDDSFVTDEDVPAVLDVSTNDTSPAGPLVIESFTQPENGTVTDNGDGTLTFTPTPDFHGETSFEYTIRVSSQPSMFGSDTASVEITVTSVNDAPQVAANVLALTVDEGIVVENSGTFHDVDATDQVAVTASIGSITQDVGNSGQWNWSYLATDDESSTVTITADDGHGGITATTFELTVRNVAPRFAPPASASPLFELSTLLPESGGDGSLGFVINGEPGSSAGYSVSGIGDVNGDGLNDVLIGAMGANNAAGAAYVVFGSNEPRSSIDTALLAGADGFAINGAPEEMAGWSVSGAGDVNGDELDDILIGAMNANQGAGAAYVVYGRDAASDPFPAAVELATLDSERGFKFNGTNPGEMVGWSVSGAGDVNQDGFDDVLLGAFGANQWSGAGYLVFGRDESFASPLDATSLGGGIGFSMYGEAGAMVGWSVGGGGDLNGDGADDLLIGDMMGRIYVVFGDVSPADTLHLAQLDGTNGFVIEGGPVAANSKMLDGGGDYNADGFDDILIGSMAANEGAGAAYVIHGRDGQFPPQLSLSSLTAAEGYQIPGLLPEDSLGWSASNAGDVNADGVDDLLLGAIGLEGVGGGYVVYGDPEFSAATFDLGSLDGSNGYAIVGVEPGETAGFSVSGTGDVDGDGIGDLLVSSLGSETERNFVVYGRPTVSVIEPSEIEEGGTVVFNATLIDPGALDVHTVQLDWGDGHVETQTLNVGERSFSAEHQYQDDGPSPGNGIPQHTYTISVTILDDDGGVGSNLTTTPEAEVVKDNIFAMGQWMEPYTWEEVAGTLYFYAYAEQNGEWTYGIWKSDGTPEGTVPVHIIPSSTAYELTAVGDKLFYTAYVDGYGWELWVIDGSQSEPQVIDLISGPTDGNPMGLTAVGDTLFFSAMNPELTAQVLWKSDGTPEGTVVVKDDIFAMGQWMEPYTWEEVAGTLYFYAYAEQNGEWTYGIWKSDGTPEGTVPVHIIPSSTAYELTAVGDKLFYTAYVDGYGWELWVIDGSQSEPQVIDLISGPTDGNPMGLTAVGDTLFFSAMNPEFTAQVLWKVETAGPPLEVTVHNVPPAADAGADQAVTVGMAVSFAGSFTDPGTLDVHTVTWDFGDGTPVVTGGLEPTHTFSDAGVYTVTLTVMDDDGGVSSDQLTVNVITAEQQILLIGQQIAALVESDLLRENDAKPLNTSLEHALGELMDGDTHVGINNLQAFQHKVQALLNSERISEDDGEALLAAAQAAIDSALFVAGSNEYAAFAESDNGDINWLDLEDDLISELAVDRNSKVVKGKGKK